MPEYDPLEGALVNDHTGSMETAGDWPPQIPPRRMEAVPVCRGGEHELAGELLYQLTDDYRYATDLRAGWRATAPAGPAPRAAWPMPSPRWWP